MALFRMSWWRIAVLGTWLLAGVTPAQAQEDEEYAEPLGLTWSGTVTISEDVTWLVVPPNTVTNAFGSSITTKHEIRTNTQITVTLKEGVGTATVSESGQSELSAVYAGCWNGRYVLGGESQFQGSTAAGVGVSIDDTGSYTISVGVLGGVPGRNVESVTFEGPNSDCNGTSVDFEALGLPRGTRSKSTPGVTTSSSFEFEGTAEPGATTITGSAPTWRGGTISYALTASGCDGAGNDEVDALLERERPGLNRELGTEEPALEDAGGEAGLTLIAASLSQPQPNASQPVDSQTASTSIQAAVGGGDRVELIDVSSGSGGGLVRFAVRLGSAGQPLLSHDAIARIVGSACVQPGSFEGARTLLVGSVQWTADGQFRINVRTVDTETGVVTATASSTGTGGAAELGAALGPLLGSLLAS